MSVIPSFARYSTRIVASENRNSLLNWRRYVAVSTEESDIVQLREFLRKACPRNSVRRVAFRTNSFISAVIRTGIASRVLVSVAEHDKRLARKRKGVHRTHRSWKPITWSQPSRVGRI